MNFYKAKMLPAEEGLEVWFDIFKPIHETACFYFCVNALRLATAKRIIESNPEINPVTAVKTSNYIRVVRIAKSGSRIAEPSREQALENLVIRTKRRIGHMKRDIEFCEAFIGKQDNIKTTYDDGRQLVMRVDDTKDLVHEYYNSFFNH